MHKQRKNGIGEASTFAACHPVVNLSFFAFAIGITMFSNDPVFLAVTIVFSWAYAYLLSGTKALKFNFLMSLPILAVMAVVNTLFTHNGATVLFYLSGNRITLEAFLFGLASACLLSAVIVWFTCFQVVMSADKLIYLFGKVAPTLGLTLSMIFRFIPLLKTRFREISMGQRCMGRHGQKGLMARGRQLIKEVSILISWSLEASIETADSMEARGYGLPGRTSFHLFTFSPQDKRLLLMLCISGGIAMTGCALGETSIYYYPKVVLGHWNGLRLLTLLAYSVLLALPLMTDWLGEKRWQRLHCEI